MGILEEVNASYEKLSPVQKRIADFIFKYPDQVCFYSLKELSETLGVTEVTILRFTKKIGAQSFVEMKNRLREHLQTRLVHGDGLNRIADHVGGIRFGDHDKEEMFQEFVANEKNVIAKTFEQVSLKDILSAVAIIRQSRKIYVVGSERGVLPIPPFQQKKTSRPQKAGSQPECGHQHAEPFSHTIFCRNRHIAELLCQNSAHSITH